jgi:hypothetical protein
MAKIDWMGLPFRLTFSKERYALFYSKFQYCGIKRRIHVRQLGNCDLFLKKICN